MASTVLPAPSPGWRWLHRCCLPLGVVALECVAPTASWAVASASADMALHWTLTDLDPFDGVTPSVTFDDRSYLFAEAGVDSWAPDRAISVGDIGQMTFVTAGGGPSSFMEARIEPANDGYRLSAVGRAPGGDSYFFGHSRFFERGCCFTLSPHTEATITGTVTLEVRRSTAEGERSSAGALLQAVGPGVGEAGYVEDELGVGLGLGDSLSFRTGTLQVTYSNASAEPLWGGFEAMVSISGSSASPIPEPPVPAALLVGLAFCGALHRRQRTTVRRGGPDDKA